MRFEVPYKLNDVGYNLFHALFSVCRDGTFIQNFSVCRDYAAFYARAAEIDTVYTFSIFALPAEKFFYRFRVAFSPRAISFNILAFLFAFVKRKILNIAILTLQYCFFYFFLLFF